MTVISVVERVLPVCGQCGAPLRRARSIMEGLCCCERNTCHTPEPFGCIVCGAFLIGRTDEVLGMCVRCQVVTQSPAVAVAPRCAAAGTNSDLPTGSA